MSWRALLGVVMLALALYILSIPAQEILARHGFTAVALP